MRMGSPTSVMSSPRPGGDERPQHRQPDDRDRQVEQQVERLAVGAWLEERAEEPHGATVAPASPGSSRHQASGRSAGRLTRSARRGPGPARPTTVVGAFARGRPGAVPASSRPRVAQRLHDQPVGEPGIAREERPVEVRPERGAAADALVAALAVVSVPGDDAAERQRRRGRGSCGPRGFRTRRSCAARRARARTRGGRPRSSVVHPPSCAGRRRPRRAARRPRGRGRSARAAGSRRRPPERPRRPRSPPRALRPSRRCRRRRAPARGPGRRRRRGGRARRASTGSPSPIVR